MNSSTLLFVIKNLTHHSLAKYISNKSCFSAAEVHWPLAVVELMVWGQFKEILLLTSHQLQFLNYLLNDCQWLRCYQEVLKKEKNMHTHMYICMDVYVCTVLVIQNTKQRPHLVSLKIVLISSRLSCFILISRGGYRERLLYRSHPFFIVSLINDTAYIFYSVLLLFKTLMVY